MAKYYKDPKDLTEKELEELQKLSDSIDDKEEFIRFRWPHRVLHAMLIISISNQGFTGFVLRYRNAAWAQWLVAKMGGVPTAGLLHRIGGATFLFVVGAHVIWLIYYLLVMRGEAYGPTSMLFRLEDIFHLRDNIKYMLGLGPEPKFDRFTYFEKFDWFAVFWGALAIGLTGLMLWFKEFFGRFLPGQALNIATIAHSDEALLAMGFLFFVHWYNAHFSPVYYPINTVIFTGTETKEILMHERPMEWLRLLANPWMMEKRRVKKKKK